MESRRKALSSMMDDLMKLAASGLNPGAGVAAGAGGGFNPGTVAAASPSQSAAIGLPS